MFSRIRNALTGQGQPQSPATRNQPKSRVRGQYGTLNRYMSNHVKQFQYNEQGASLAVEASVWAYRCIETRARLVSSVPFKVIDMTTGDSVQGVTPFHMALLWGFIKYGQDLIYMHQFHLCIFGEVYEEKMLNEDGQPGGFRNLNPLAIEPFTVPGYIEYYEYYQDDGRVVPYMPQEIIMDKYPHPRNDLRGYSPMVLALRSVNVDEMAIRHAMGFYKNEGVSGGYVTLRQNTEGLSDDEIDHLLEVWEDQAGADNAYSTRLLPWALEYHQTDIKPPDQNGNLDEAHRRRICATFDVPMPVVGAMDVSDPLGGGGAMSEHKALLYENRIKPECKALDQHWNAHLMPWLMPGYKIEHDFTEIDSLIRHTLDRSTRVNQDIAGTIISVNEGRKQLGLDEKPGWDIHLVKAGTYAIPADRPDLINELAQSALQIPLSDMSLTHTPQAPALGTPRDAGTLITPATRSLQMDNNVKRIVERSLPPMPDNNKMSLGTPGGTVLLRLSPNTLPMAISVKEMLTGQFPAESRVRWTAIEDIHITLISSPLIDELDINEIIDQYMNDGAFKPVPLRIVGVDVFNLDDFNVVYLGIEMTDELKALHTEIYEMLQSRGVPMSELSKPENYTPHITLGYFDPTLSLPDFDIEIGINGHADSMEVSRSYYRPDFTVVSSNTEPNLKDVFEGKETKAVIDGWQVKALDEIGKWQKFNKNSTGKKSARVFKTQFIPSDIAGEIRVHLQNKSVDARSVFMAGESAIRDRSLTYDRHLRTVTEGAIDDNAVLMALNRLNELGADVEPLVNQVNQIVGDDEDDSDIS